MMPMAIDNKKVEEHIRGLLAAIGENPDREGLRETPARVARMYEEIFEGVCYTNDEIAEKFNRTFEEDLVIPQDNKEIVFVRDIDIFSYCEHHLALMYNMKAAIAYIPNGKILGLSKIARIADMVGKRLQLQERIGSDIAEIMQKITDSEDVAVIIEGQHACMTTRGIKNTGALTTSTTLRGRFNTDINFTNRLMLLYK
ncbi:MAG: cyclohydrolase [Eubacterium sp.]|jgi:GTP cyclohydrolase I|nr:cyclohydrolase [Eubacterium sp.]